MDKKEAAKILAIIFISILFLILLRIYIFPVIGITGDGIVKITDKNKFPYPECNINNVIPYLESLNILNELPKGAYIQLRIYKDEEGDRIIIGNYIVRKKKVELGEAKDPDMEFLLNVKHLDSIANDFCSTVQKAKQAKEIIFKSDISSISLYIKYMKVYKYRKCLGII